MLIFVVLAFFALCVGYSVKSLVHYAYALAKEVRHADSANWNWRVDNGNAALAKGDWEAAVTHFEGAVDGPGQALGAESMRDRIQRLRQSAALSNTLLARGDRLADSGQIHVAVEFFRQAVAVFKHNAIAKRRLVDLQARFEGEREAGRDFFTFCNQRRLDQIISRSAEFLFFVRNSASLARNEERLTPEQQTRSLSSICFQARQFPSFEKYFEDVERSLFRPDKIQELM